MLDVHESWNPVLGPLYQEPLVTLNNTILPNISYYPKREDIFNSFKRDMKNVKVVILGQDPYPTPETAIGYAFAVNENRNIPPSLRIIRQELDSSYEDTDWGNSYLMGSSIPTWKTLQHWVNQDVLLLNTALTVESGKAGSHLKYWEVFTKQVISYISKNNPCIWLLWGKKSQEYKAYIHKPFMVKGYDRYNVKDIPAYETNYILEAPHPAAALYGGKTTFIGCNHFYLTNEILKLNRKKQIQW